MRFSFHHNGLLVIATWLRTRQIAVRVDLIFVMKSHTLSGIPVQVVPSL